LFFMRIIRVTELRLGRDTNRDAHIFGNDPQS